ncbi:hypothetical protein X907_0577 [Glycocaulis alkaliphilus]|uniref:Uncharacterized protein n=1 Tax=Glycocaulis alkaliphilus TaxID=1434191 RepID=A0A3T0E780_9PROT|nr:hypothetical protein X907_0577 [Glycocaulis alkaliphilus]
MADQYFDHETACDHETTILREGGRLLNSFNIASVCIF